MKHARIENGIVAEIIDDGGIDIDKMFHADIVVALVPDDGAALVGGTFDGKVFGPVPVYVPTMDDARQQRDELLIDADHAINHALDNALDAAPWRVYRQALRDLPTTFTDPAKVVWPIEPV